jgi:Lon protease-like protein
MADEQFEIPLFPVNLVLFPGMALPLHIFEPRYREMTEHCLEDHAPFGIVHACPEDEGGLPDLARVGTLARICDVHRLPDGRFNLLTMGTQRFEIVELRHEKPYLVGIVRPYRDVNEAEAVSNTQVEAARNALREYLHFISTLVGSETKRLVIPCDPQELSFVIGMCLTSEDDLKQGILEMRSVDERLKMGTKLLVEERALLQAQLESNDRHKHAHDHSLLN